MKPKIYFGTNPQQFAPCEAALAQMETSVKMHPSALSIRNKRKRMRWVKTAHRIGVKTFLRVAWEIYPEKANG